jgi:hypothetical protein
MRYVGQTFPFVITAVLQQNGKRNVHPFLQFSVMLRYVKYY